MITVSTYTPWPKQQEFHRSPAKYRLFGGAAGPGKSAAITWEGVIQANEVANADTLLLRRTFPELEESLLREFRRNVPREMYKSYNDSKHVVTWWNGSTTRFGYCESESDVYQYQGAEFLFIGVDELTLFTLKQWQFLTSRNRCPVAGSYPNMAGATNPGNRGHSWVKSLWIDKKPAIGMERPEQYDKRDYDFIAAKLEDNPIYADDTEYRRTLNALPTHMRAAFLDGSWDLFPDQYFDIFDPKLNGRHVRKVVDLRDWYTRWISIDWGFAHNCAVYWHVTLPDGRFATYRELIVNNLEPQRLARRIHSECNGERISDIFISPDADNRRDSPDTIYKQMSREFEALGLPPCRKADDDRKGGWMLIYQLLRNDMVVIDESCVNLIAKLPEAVRDPDNMEDIVKQDGDDEIDSFRYGYKSRLEPTQAPLGIRMQANLDALEDMRDQYGRPFSRTAVMMRLEQARKREEEATQGQPWNLRIR